VDLFVGGLVGAVMAVLVAEGVRRYQLPRVKFLGVESTKPERGLAGGEQYLRRIRFKAKGSTVGTATSIRLRWGPAPAQATIAKWDETPEPVETNPVTGAGENPPNLVPATFYLPLYAGEEYTVPVLIDWQAPDRRVTDVFCGWWYIERQPDRYRLRVDPDDSLEIKVQGMPWIVGWFRRRQTKKALTVAELQAAPLRPEGPERGGPD
jgi:hypothetical protein